ncbi:MAG: fused MFS/spermidine synthase [Deltaproteobacteria bacterium]|nr:fused MFS/spermidine synthase [Deltaproteobacteria bacterium]
MRAEAVETGPPGQRLRQVVLGATFATGLTGLVNEVAWQRALAALLGSDGEAAAAVLATFLGGLAAGYAFFGRVSRRGHGGPTLLRLYALAEAGIGFWALAFPSLFRGLQSLSISRGAGGEAAGAAFDVALAALLLAPPTFLMGATLPLLTQALARDLPDATRLHARVYGTNAAGGFVGALLAGLWWLPALGIPGTLRATGVVNLVAGVVFYAVSHRAPDSAATEPGADGPALPPTPLRVYAAAALLLGFAMIALQTVWIRVGALAFGASDLTFAVVVATFVLCLALGSLAVGAARNIPRAAAVACPAAVALLLAGLYPALQYAPYAAHRLRIAVGNGDGAYLRFELGAAGLVLAAGLLPLGLAGASLPLIFHALRRRMDDLGAVVGRLYAWNTLGSVLGALVGGHALLLWFDLHHVYRISVAAIVVATGLLALRETRWPWPAAAATTLALVGLIALPAWDPTELSTGHLRMRTATAASYLGPEAMAATRDGVFVFAADDPVTTLLVTDHTLDDRRVSRALHTQGKSDGSLIPDYPTMALTGLVPCLLARSCEQAFVIGLGTGVTGGELAELESVRRVVVAEISPAVVQALPLFDHGNRALSKSPKLELIADDAYHGLLARDETWDIIVSEPSHPWASGVERLYSLEFLVAARERLAPGGVYAQWMHSYEMDDATLALVLRTFAAAFQDVAVWYSNGPDLLLLGLTPEVARPDLARVARRARQPDFRAGLKRADVESWWALLAHELIPAGVIDRNALPGPLHTLLHPRLAHRAGRAFFHDDQARLPRFVSRKVSARGRKASLGNRREPKHDKQWRAIIDETCESRAFECATRIAAWHHAEPDSVAPPQARDHWVEEHPDHLMPERMEVLAALFGDGLEGLDAESAQRVTDHYLAYYDQTRPFRRGALVTTWKACVGAGCRAGLHDTRARLDASEAWIEQDLSSGVTR